MADGSGSDGCVGFKRRIAEVVSEAAGGDEQETLQRPQESSPNCVSALLVVATAEEEQQPSGTASLPESAWNLDSASISPSLEKKPKRSSDSLLEYDDSKQLLREEPDCTDKESSLGEKVGLSVSGIQECDAPMAEVGKGSVVGDGKESVGSSSQALQVDGYQEIPKDSFFSIRESGDEPISGSGTNFPFVQVTGVDDANGNLPKINMERGIVETHVQEYVYPAGKGSGFEEMSMIAPLIRSSVNIEVIDETALVQSPSVSRSGNGARKGMGFVNGSRNLEGNEKKIAGEDVMAGKKGSKSRRRGKGVKKALEATGNQYPSGIHMIEPLSVAQKNVAGCYTRQQMEALRFVNIGEQKKLWHEIYHALSPVVAKEYDDLTRCSYQSKPINSGYNSRQPLGKKEERSAVLGGASSGKVVIEVESSKDSYIKNANALEDFDQSLNADDDNTLVEDECIEDSDSDEEYSSILKPAFSVDGDPNFESGPPEDGLEYLRRVRWEATQIPNFKVAKLDRNKLNKEQTVYMPIIPDIANCPDHLLPSKEWEDAFLVDFSALRLAVLGLEASNDNDPHKADKLHSVFTFHEFRQLPEKSPIIENVDELETEEEDSRKPFDCAPAETLNSHDYSSAFDDTASGSPEEADPIFSMNRSSINKPTLSVILGMDSVARVSMLKRSISSIERMTSISKDDCLWLYALCAGVDAPLDADTCAALRCLLRKCASLRAAKSEVDDEVVMLNILATVAGRYFGQLEK